MALKQDDGAAALNAKRRKRVAFADDPGVEPNECIEVFLVHSQNDISGANTPFINLIDLSSFFGDDGKIYGYKNLKIKIWLSLVSFQSYADIKYESTFDGGKGITDLKDALQKIFGESLLDQKEFIESFSTESQYVENILSSGVSVPADFSRQGKVSEGSRDRVVSTIEVIRMDIHSLPVGTLYSRLLPLALLLIEGCTPIEVTDPRWEIYFVVKKEQCPLENRSLTLLGFATVYRFYHYPDSVRLRISQILVFPPYQGRGYGHCLLAAVNHVAVSEDAYDVTMEEPSQGLLDLRTRMDTLRLLTFDPVSTAVASAVSILKEANVSKKAGETSWWPPPSAVETARQKLKVNKKQLQSCWDVLVYLGLDATKDPSHMKSFRDAVTDHIRADILGKEGSSDRRRCLVEVPNDYGHDKTFVVSRRPAGTAPDDVDGDLEGDQELDQEAQLKLVVEEHLRQVAEIANMVR